MAVVCAYGERNTVNHALMYRKGGFVITTKLGTLRRSFLMRCAFSDKKEPTILPLSGEIVRGNQGDEARLDVSAIDLSRSEGYPFNSHVRQWRGQKIRNQTRQIKIGNI